MIKYPFYLRAAGRGIIKIQRHKKIKSLFCRHIDTVTGSHCSANGMGRISGADLYTVCSSCGKVLSEKHINF